MSSLFAVIPAIVIGIALVMIGAIGGNLRQQVLGIGFGAWLAGIASWILLDAHADFIPLLICFAAGFLIVLGNRMLFMSYKVSGIAYSMAVTTGQQLVAVSLLGVVIFGEWAQISARFYGGLALVLLTIGTALAVYTEKKPLGATNTVSPWRRLAIITAASIPYAIYPIAVQASGIDADAVGAPVMTGLLVGSFLITIPGPKGHTVNDPASADDWIDGGSRWGIRTLKLAGAGILWGSGCIGMLWCMDRIGIATSFPLAQLNVIISVLGGILVLGEKKTPREGRALAAGLVLLLTGAVFIGLAKAADTPI